MELSILVTLGPSSLKEDIIKLCARENVSLFRINLSHTPLEQVELIIKKIQQWTDVPICLDSEGAQIRNQSMISDQVVFEEGETVKLHFDEVVGDSRNISFTPRQIVPNLSPGVGLMVDFNTVCLRVIEKYSDHCLAKVESGGIVGSNKATDLVDVEQEISLSPITEKDKKAFEIGKKLGINHFALSFTNSKSDVEQMREIVGPTATIISKIESRKGVCNLLEILDVVDQILIDRGDLSRQLPIEKIPFLQRRIISMARAKGKPVFVATNLLESMVTTPSPTRAEVNDVVSTLLDGANGLVLAAETAIGMFPVEAVRMIRGLMNQYIKWTPNSSITEIIEN
jgi:pyruvate kinase